MKAIISRYGKTCLLILGVYLCTGAYSQQYFNNPAGQYYRNGYLWNPAYAGTKNHPSIYALLNNSWIGFDGAPTLVMLTGDVAFGRNSGGGIKFISDKSGLLQRTTVTADFSFAVKFNDKERLRLGVSTGVFSERINTSGQYDPLTVVYNAKGTIVDGNFGAVYESGQFTFGTAVYNLRTMLQKSSDQQADVAKANFMTSYNFILSGNNRISIKPLAAYKLFSVSSGLLALGTQFEYSKLFNTSLIWQNTGSMIGNLGLTLYQAAEINFSYASNNKYGYGQQYELGLGIGLH